MRITHFVPALTKGGAESVLVALANEAADAGHKVTVLVAFQVDPSLMQDKLRDTVSVRVMNPPGRGMALRYLTMWPWLWRNREWVFAQDVIHCHLTFAALGGTAVQWMRALMRSSGPRVVETFHAAGMPLPWWKRTMFHKLGSGRDGYAMMAQAGTDWRFPKRPAMPVMFIPNGINLDVVHPGDAAAAAYRKAVGIPANARFVVGTVGRIIRDRAPLSIIAVYARMAQILPIDVHFFIGGEGPMRDEVIAEAERLGFAGRLHLPGLVVDVQTAFAAIDLYLTINVGEVTGVAGLEAAALGLPVIAVNTRAGYDGANDWIWSHTDPVVVGDRAAELLQDAPRRNALAAVQQQHVHAHFSARTMWAEYEELYRRAGASSAC